jgi:hypothetical protein
MDGLTTSSTLACLRSAEDAQHIRRFVTGNVTLVAIRHCSTQASLATEAASLVAKAPAWFDRLLSRRAEQSLLHNLSWMCSTPPHHDDTVGGSDNVGLTPEAHHCYGGQSAAVKVTALLRCSWGVYACGRSTVHAFVTRGESGPFDKGPVGT